MWDHGLAHSRCSDRVPPRPQGLPPTGSPLGHSFVKGDGGVSPLAPQAVLTPKQLSTGHPGTCPVMCGSGQGDTEHGGGSISNTHACVSHGLDAGGPRARRGQVGSPAASLLGSHMVVPPYVCPGLFL